MLQRQIVIIWGVDGVIVDTEARHRYTLECIAREHNAAITTQDWQHLQGHSLKYIHGWLQSYFGDFTMSLADFYAESRQRYMADDALITPRPDIEQTIMTLQAAGCAQGVVTQAPSAVLDKHLNIAKLTRADFDYAKDTAVIAQLQQVGAQTAQNANVARPHYILFDSNPVTLKAAKILGWTTIQCMQPEHMNILRSPAADHALSANGSALKLIRTLLEVHENKQMCKMPHPKF